MKEYQSGDIRNFAIVGHGASGKTMLSEAMLACSGSISRLGSVANGSTVSDYHEDEQKRQISIHASLLHAEWQGKKLNIIDTPGYSDFISESLGALRVSDSAVVVLHVKDGVQVGTEQVWEYANIYNIPKVIVINAVDKEETSFDQALEQAREIFGERVFPLTIPVNPGPGFNQIVDVLRAEFITYQTDGMGKYEESTATGEWKEKSEKLHEELIEYIAESDDALLEKFFEEGTLSEEEMRAGLHSAVQRQTFIPLFCTSAENNVGVSRLMDFISKYGASPLDRGAAKAVDASGADIEIELSHKNPTAYIFKTLSEAHLGEMSFFRLYSGTLETGTDLYNSEKKVSERIGQIYLLNGKSRDSVKVLHGGDIAAVVKLKDTHTNDTLCHPKELVKLERVEYPKPNIHTALKPKSKGEEEKIATGLATLHEEDPTFLYKVDSELHQTVLSGQGELHLQVISDRLKNRFKVEIELLKPKVPFRETIRGKGESKYRHKKQSGGAGQFAEVWMRIEPKTRGEGVEFTQSLVGQNVDRVFVPSVEKGVMAACEEGVIAGYKVVDVKVDFYDGKQHPVDSKDVAFQIAGKHALRQAFREAKPCLLEPIYEITVKVPEECMGDVMGDISSRRGKILGMDSEGRFQVVKAQVPQMELHQYSTTLRSMTGGRGIHSEDFSHYNEMPHEIEQKVVEEGKKDEEE
ncbi:MAG: elongation factor G [SAR324 cluster bacterium]|nr:elongation factor G [SAR324 cluster bacterium]